MYVSFSGKMDRNQENVSLKNKIKEMGILNCFKKQVVWFEFGLKQAVK